MTWGVPLLVSYHIAFSYCSWGSQGKNTEVLAIPFSSGPLSVRPLHHDLPVLGSPQAWLGFIDLDKALVLVWLDWLVFCEYGFSVPALWCPLATPTILLGFLLPWVWGISSWLLQQSTPAAPYLGRWVSPYRHRSWPSTWDSSSRPSCACAATTPQVAPPGHRPNSINYNVSHNQGLPHSKESELIWCDFPIPLSL